MFRDGNFPPVPPIEQGPKKLPISELAKVAHPLVDNYTAVMRAQHTSEKAGKEAVIAKLCADDPKFKEVYDRSGVLWEEQIEPMLRPGSKALPEDKRLELVQLLIDATSDKYTEVKAENELPPNIEEQLLAMFEARSKYCQANPDQQKEIDQRRAAINQQIEKTLKDLKTKTGESFFGTPRSFGGVNQEVTLPLGYVENFIQWLKDGTYPENFLGDQAVKDKISHESAVEVERLGQLRAEIIDTDLANDYFTIEKNYTRNVLEKLMEKGIVLAD